MGNFRETRHEHHVAGDDDDEVCAGGEESVSNRERPIFRRAELLGIVGERVLRFGDTDGQIGETKGSKPFQFLPRSVEKFDAACAIDSLRDNRNFLGSYAKALIRGRGRAY